MKTLGDFSIGVFWRLNHHKPRFWYRFGRFPGAPGQRDHIGTLVMPLGGVGQEKSTKNDQPFFSWAEAALGLLFVRASCPFRRVRPSLNLVRPYVTPHFSLPRTGGAAGLPVCFLALFLGDPHLSYR